MRVEAKVVSGHQTGVDPEGTVIPILSGNVSSDGLADVRSSLDMTTEPALWPSTADDLLAPYGNEIFVRRGIEYGDRTVEWVSLGYYRIDNPSQDDIPFGEIDVTGSDRMVGIVEAELEAPRQFQIGTTFEAVFEELIQEVYPTAVVEFDFDATSVVLNRGTIAEEKRYEFLRDLSDAYAKDFYVDYRGIFVVKDRPDPGNPVFEANSGPNGVLIRAGREISREGVYNAVVATGEGADELPPVRAIAFDNNPDSPTYYLGENTSGRIYGKVPRRYSSPFIETEEQAKSAATKILLDNLGLPFSLEFSAVPNPALEPFDPVRVRTKNHDYTHVLQGVTIGLTADEPLAATTKDQTTIDIGLE